jgi:hypothetical protein
MASIADFVGTWYFRGDNYIRSHGAKLAVVDEKSNAYPAHVERENVMVSENLANWGLKGTLSSDAKLIAWNNGEIWKP